MFHLFKYIRFFFLIFVLVVIGVRSSFAVVPNLDLIDSITAVTLPRASYDIGITAYDSGSIQKKAILGLHDNIYLGASFAIENLIGSETVAVNIPGVIAKFKLTDGWERFPVLMAVGYDSFYLGDEGKINTNTNVKPFNRVIYGPYIALSRPVFMFGMEQHLHLGVRMPVQPDYIPEDTAMYISFDFPMGVFIPMVEVSRIYFSGDRLDEALINFGFKLAILENFSIELNFLTRKNQNMSRILVLEYVDYF